MLLWTVTENAFIRYIRFEYVITPDYSIETFEFRAIEGRINLK